MLISEDEKRCNTCQIVKHCKKFGRDKNQRKGRCAKCLACIYKRRHELLESRRRAKMRGQLDIETMAPKISQMVFQPGTNYAGGIVEIRSKRVGIYCEIDMRPL